MIANSPGVPAGLIDPISGPLGTLEYDHQDGISITGGFVYHGAGIPQLDGKYVFGDLALVGAPVRIDGRLFYADLQTGQINEFQLPQLSNGKLPNQLTVHGFGLGRRRRNLRHDHQYPCQRHRRHRLQAGGLRARTDLQRVALGCRPAAWPREASQKMSRRALALGFASLLARDFLAVQGSGATQLR